MSKAPSQIFSDDKQNKQNKQKKMDTIRKMYHDLLLGAESKVKDERFSLPFVGKLGGRSTLQVLAELKQAFLEEKIPGDVYVKAFLFSRDYPEQTYMPKPKDGDEKKIGLLKKVTPLVSEYVTVERPNEVKAILEKLLLLWGLLEKWVEQTNPKVHEFRRKINALQEQLLLTRKGQLSVYLSAVTELSNKMPLAKILKMHSAIEGFLARASAELKIEGIELKQQDKESASEDLLEQIAGNLDEGELYLLANSNINLQERHSELTARVANAKQHKKLLEEWLVKIQENQNKDKNIFYWNELHRGQETAMEAVSEFVPPKSRPQLDEFLQKSLGKLKESQKTLAEINKRTIADGISPVSVADPEAHQWDWKQMQFESFGAINPDLPGVLARGYQANARSFDAFLKYINFIAVHLEALFKMADQVSELVILDDFFKTYQAPENGGYIKGFDKINRASQLLTTLMKFFMYYGEIQEIYLDELKAYWNESNMVIQAQQRLNKIKELLGPVLRKNTEAEEALNKAKEELKNVAKQKDALKEAHAKVSLEEAILKLTEAQKELKEPANVENLRLLNEAKETLKKVKRIEKRQFFQKKAADLAQQFMSEDSRSILDFFGAAPEAKQVSAFPFPLLAEIAQVVFQTTDYFDKNSRKIQELFGRKFILTDDGGDQWRLRSARPDYTDGTFLELFLIGPDAKQEELFWKSNKKIPATNVPQPFALCTVPDEMLSKLTMEKLQEMVQHAISRGYYHPYLRPCLRYVENERAFIASLMTMIYRIEIGKEKDKSYYSDKTSGDKRIETELVNELRDLFEKAARYQVAARELQALLSKSQVASSPDCVALCALLGRKVQAMNSFVTSLEISKQKRFKEYLEYGRKAAAEMDKTIKEQDAADLNKVTTVAGACLAREVSYHVPQQQSSDPLVRRGSVVVPPTPRANSSSSSSNQVSSSLSDSESSQSSSSSPSSSSAPTDSKSSSIPPAPEIETGLEIESIQVVRKEDKGLSYSSSSSSMSRASSSSADVLVPPVSGKSKNSQSASSSSSSSSSSAAASSSSASSSAIPSIGDDVPTDELKTQDGAPVPPPAPPIDEMLVLSASSSAAIKSSSTPTPPPSLPVSSDLKSKDGENKGENVDRSDLLASIQKGRKLRKVKPSEQRISNSLTQEEKTPPSASSSGGLHSLIAQAMVVRRDAMRPKQDSSKIIDELKKQKERYEKAQAAVEKAKQDLKKIEPEASAWAELPEREDDFHQMEDHGGYRKASAALKVAEEALLTCTVSLDDAIRSFEKAGSARSESPDLARWIAQYRNLQSPSPSFPLSSSAKGGDRSATGAGAGFFKMNSGGGASNASSSSGSSSSNSSSQSSSSSSSSSSRASSSSSSSADSIYTYTPGGSRSTPSSSSMSSGSSSSSSSVSSDSSSSTPSSIVPK